MKNWQRVIICVMLIMSVFAMSISVFAVDPTPVPTPDNPDDPLINIVTETAMYYIWACMRAWGISIAYNNIEEFSDEINQLLEDYVLQFLDSLPSAYSISTWIAPWQASFDYWGNLRLNESALDDIQSFVDWLTGYENIQDNSTQVLNAIYLIDNIRLYQINTWYSATNYGNESYLDNYNVVGIFGTSNQSMINAQPTNLTGFAKYYFFAKIRSNNQWVMVNVDENSWTVTSWNTVPYYIRSTNFEGYTFSSVSTSSPELRGQLYANTAYGSHYALMPTDATVYSAADMSELINFISHASIVENGDYKVITTNILLPDDDPNYVTGDSITIVDNSPDYSVIEWSGQVTVDNLPAVVSTNTIENPHLEEAYRPIQGLIEYAKEGISVGTALLYELPDELVYMWYAVIASLVIWGMIKLMREH